MDEHFQIMCAVLTAFKLLVLVFIPLAPFRAVYGDLRVFEYPEPNVLPLIFSAESRSVEAKAAEYCLYLDLTHSDGSNTWAIRASFPEGTHDWVEARGVYVPTKPVSKVNFYAFLRNGTGTAEFRNLKLERREPTTEEAKRPFGGVRRTLRPFAAADEIEGQVYDAKRRKVVDQTVRAEACVGPISPLGAGKSAVWVADSMRRITPLTFPTLAEQVSPARIDIDLARNESESVQLLVSTAKDVAWERGELRLPPALVAADGRRLKGALKWERQGYLKRKTIKASYGFHPLAFDSSEAWFPDPLLPAAPFKVRKGATQGLWVTVRCDRDAVPGLYGGQIDVLRDGQVVDKVPLSVMVRDFVQPETFGLKTAFAVMDGYTRVKYPQDYERRRRQSWDVMLDHRLNPDDITRHEPPPVDDLEYARKRGMNSFSILNLVPPPKSEKEIWVHSTTPEMLDNPEFYAYLKAKLTPYVGDLRRRGLLPYGYLYGFDEREHEHYAGIDRLWRKLKADFPDVPVMTTSRQYRDLKNGKNYPCLESGDWFCPSTSTYDSELSDRLRAKGKHIWWYTCCGPYYPYANFASYENPLIEGRLVVGWMTYRYRAEGFLFWAVNLWDGDGRAVVDDTDTFFPEWDTFSGNHAPGDGVLLYPTSHGVVASIRLAQIRDAVEDYELLAAAERRFGRSAVEALTSRLVESMTRFSREPAKLRQVRSELLMKMGRETELTCPCRLK